MCPIVISHDSKARIEGDGSRTWRSNSAFRGRPRSCRSASSSWIFHRVRRRQTSRPDCPATRKPDNRPCKSGRTGSHRDRKTGAAIKHGRPAFLQRLPDGKRKADLRTELDFTLSRLVGSRILPFDLAAARLPGIAALTEATGRKTSIADGQIAAIAITRGGAIATRGNSPFQDAGVAVIDPWADRRWPNSRRGRPASDQPKHCLRDMKPEQKSGHADPPVGRG